MAGFTPFQFSSRKLQFSTTGFLGKTVNNLVGEQLNTLLSWYEMWINPQQLSLKYSFQQSVQYTAGSIVTFHYGRTIMEMSVSGVCGWIAIQSETSMLANLAMQGIMQQSMKATKSFGDNMLKKFKSSQLFMRNYSTYTGKSVSFNNSPRQFLERLQNLANEPMYFIDKEGIEHYNTKYIKIFTKRYPEGVICEGYFTSFEIPESADDVQTINYRFTFNVENIKPIGLIERSLGMFAGLGSGAGDLIRSLGL